MFLLLFKFKRYIKNSYLKLSNKIKLLEWQKLHKNRFIYGKEITMGTMFKIFFDDSTSVIKMGDVVQFRSFCQIRSGMNGTLVIGNRVFFNSYCSINCMQEIIIGDDCQFGEGVKFYDHNHKSNNKCFKINEQGYSTGNIRVGNNCWIGSDVIILKDVEIGDNVIIGAGCIIHKSIPSNSKIVSEQHLKLLK